MLTKTFTAFEADIAKAQKRHQDKKTSKLEEQPSVRITLLPAATGSGKTFHSENCIANRGHRRGHVHELCDLHGLVEDAGVVLTCRRTHR